MENGDPDSHRERKPSNLRLKSTYSSTILTMFNKIKWSTTARLSKRKMPLKRNCPSTREWDQQDVDYEDQKLEKISLKLPNQAYSYCV